MKKKLVLKKLLSNDVDECKKFKNVGTYKKCWPAQKMLVTIKLDI